MLNTIYEDFEKRIFNLHTADNFISKKEIKERANILYQKIFYCTLLNNNSKRKLYNLLDKI